ncbi:MAG: hypothetical protein ACOCT9_03065, partial [archaeon]
MKKISVSNNEHLLPETSIFDLGEAIRTLMENDWGILILLDFIKANEWPVKEPFSHDPKTIPLIWAIFFVEDDELKYFYDIHYTKCFPKRYNKNNEDSRKHFVTVNKENLNGEIVTRCGCRTVVHLNDQEKDILEKNPEYCSIFGLPDDCYSPKFEKRMKKKLKEFTDLNVWVFDETRYLEKELEEEIDLNYMKREFIPNKHYIYTNSTLKILKGIYSNAELDCLKKYLFFTEGRDLIEKMDLDDEGFFRYEEKAEKIIQMKLIFEFIREFLLLKNKETFSDFEASGASADANKLEKVHSNINGIKREIEKKVKTHLDSIYDQIASERPIKEKLISSRFLVLDVEFIHSTYPTGKQGKFNFPCIFSNISWEGVRKGFVPKLFVFTIPCHICEKSCKEFDNNLLKFDCIKESENFIHSEIHYIEEFLCTYEGFKIYSYGDTDISELEHAMHFFSESSELPTFERKNRKRVSRIGDISEDISPEDKSLEEVEDEIENWLEGLSRKQDHIKKYSRFMTTHDSDYWEERY